MLPIEQKLHEAEALIVTLQEKLARYKNRVEAGDTERKEMQAQITKLRATITHLEGIIERLNKPRKGKS